LLPTPASLSALPSPLAVIPPENNAFVSRFQSAAGHLIRLRHCSRQALRYIRRDSRHVRNDRHRDIHVGQADGLEQFEH
jgi:hypothetical protein